MEWRRDEPIIINNNNKRGMNAYYEKVNKVCLCYIC